MPHVGALETTIVAEDWSGTIEIRSTLDGNVTNSLVERYRDLANEHLGSVDKREIGDNSVLLTVQTTQSRIPIAMAARSTVLARREPVPATYRLFDEAAEIGHDIAVRAVRRRCGDGREDRDPLHGARCRDVRTRCRRRALARPTRPVRRAARRASDRLGCICGSGCPSNSTTSQTNCASCACICCICCRRFHRTPPTSTSACRLADCTGRHIAATSSGTSCSSSRCSTCGCR